MSNIDACNKIAEIISNYRDGEFGIYNSSHVKRWIDQFDKDEQQIVLLETLEILKRNYITQNNFIQFVNTLIDSNAVYKRKKDTYWKTVSLLDIQKNGNSQHELNRILAQIIQSRYSLPISQNANHNEFIYLDDFIFSGNRLFTDMQDWILDIAPQKCRVCIITIGWFTYGQWKTGENLKKLAKKSGKEIEFSFFSYEEFRLENRRFKKDYSERFWPTNSIINLDGYDNWLQAYNIKPEYRQVNTEKNRIFSTERREDYEKIIFKYGLKIVHFSSQNSSSIKPLGFSTFRDFGFGSTVFSFRNCPNNNPLVFWWGDPNAAPSHPFSKWYPLLQRKTYAS